MRKLTACCLCLLFSLLTVGCWDQDEITALAPFSGLGIEVSARPGMLLLSAQISVPGAPSGGGGNAAGNLRVLSVETETVQEGIMELQARLRRMPFLLHLNFIVFGEQMARSGIFPAVNGLLGAAQIRGSTPVFVAAGSAEAVLKAHSGIGRHPGQDVSDLLQNAGTAAIANKTTVNDVVNTLTSTGSELAVPILDLAPLELTSTSNLPDDGTGQSGMAYREVVLNRTALFRRDRWIATLDRHQTNTLVLLLGKSRQGAGSTINPADATQPFAVRYEDVRVSYRASDLQGQAPPSFLLCPCMQVRLLEMHGGYELQERGLSPLERAIEFDFALQADQLIKELQSLGLDTLGLGQKIAAKHPRAWSELAPVWSDVYPQVKVLVEPKAELRSIGLTKKSFQIER